MTSWQGKRFLLYWTFVVGIRWWFPPQMVSNADLWYCLCYCTNNPIAGDLWRHSAHVTSIRCDTAFALSNKLNTTSHGLGGDTASLHQTGIDLIDIYIYIYSKYISKLLNTTSYAFQSQFLSCLKMSVTSKSLVIIWWRQYFQNLFTVIIIMIILVILKAGRKCRMKGL